MIHSVFYVSGPTGRSWSHDQYPSSLGGKTSYLSITSQTTALGHRGNDLYIYSLYLQCILLKKGIEGRYALFFMGIRALI